MREWGEGEGDGEGEEGRWCEEEGELGIGEEDGMCTMILCGKSVCDF